VSDNPTISGENLIPWTATGTGTNNVITGADSRLTDARVSGSGTKPYLARWGTATGTATSTQTTLSNSIISDALGIATVHGDLAVTGISDLTGDLYCDGGGEFTGSVSAGNITATPGASKVVKSDTDSKISSGWLPIVTYTAANTATATITGTQTRVDVTSFTYSGHAGSLMVWSNLRVSGTEVGGMCFAFIEVDGTLRSIDNYGADVPEAGGVITLSPMAAVSGLSSGSHTVTLRIGRTEGQTCGVEVGHGSLMGMVSFQ